MEKRRNAMVDLVNQLGEISFTELKKAFPDVSEVTLRKDLRYLDENNRIVRVHAGAKSIQDIVRHGNNYSIRETLNHEAKTIIGAKAAALIPEGCSLYISSGTSCAAFAKELPQQNMYIFTDGFMTAMAIPPYPEVRVELFGGTLNRNLMRVLGPSVIEAMDQLSFDYAILGTPGFHPDFGFAYTTQMIATTTNKAIERAQKTIILMDSSKVNYIHTPRTLLMQDIDIVVSDGNLPQEIVDIMTSNGITVL